MTSSPPRRSTLFCIVTLLLLFAGKSLQAQEPSRVEIDGKSLRAVDLDSVKKKIEEFRKLVPENSPSAGQAALGRRIDLALNKLGQLSDRMKRVDGAAMLKVELDRETRTAKAALDALATTPPSTTVDGTVDDKQINSLTAEVQTADQNISTLEAELVRIGEKESERSKSFSAASQALEALVAERTKTVTELGDDGASPERKAELAFELLRIEIDTRAIEFQRDNHVLLDELDVAARARTQAKLDLARVEKQIADTRLAAARKKLEEQLKSAREAAAAEENAKKAEARNTKYRAESAKLALEGLVAEMKKLRSDEETRRSEFNRKRDFTGADLKRQKEVESTLAQLLPENRELDQVRADLLRSQRESLEKVLPEQQKLLASLTRSVAEAQDYIATAEFKIDSLLSRMSSQLGTEDDEARSRQSDALGNWPAIIENWQAGQVEVEAQLASMPANEAKRDLSANLAKWRKDWEAAKADLQTVLDQRKKIIGETGQPGREALAQAEEIVLLLEEREARFESLAFWLRNDPPFSKISREQMVDELTKLRDELPRRIKASGEDFVGRARGILGYCGIALILLGLSLALYRRLRTDPVDRIERLFAAKRDPLAELAVVAAWLAFETGHHLLFALGLCLMARSPLPAGAAGEFGNSMASSILPTEPLACALVVIILIAALRLAASRLVAYLAEAADDVDQFLALEARRFLRFAVVGFFVTVPAVFFLERVDAPVTAEAVRFAATLWAFVLVVRLYFRSQLLVLLVPTREPSAITRSLRGLIRGVWPLVAIFVGGIVFLQFRGYKEASLFLVVRSLLAAGFLVVLSVLYQFLHAVIESRTTSMVEHAETVDQTQEFMTRARQRQLQVFSRMFSMPLRMVTLVGGVLGVAAIYGRSGARLAKLSATHVFAEALDKEGLVIPGLTWGDVGTALIIFMVGYMIACIVRDLIVVGVGVPHDDRRGGRFAVGTLAFYVLMMLTIIFGLRTMRMNLSDYNWLLGTAGVAIGFGLTEILSNFVSGLILFVERPVQVGDIVTIGDIEGDVRKISIRSTIVRTRDGVSIILPNRKLIEEDVINWSHSDQKTRLRVSVGVAYGSDVPLVKRVLLEVAENEMRVLKRPRPEIDFKGFGESELSFEVLVWLASPDITVRRRVRSDLNSAIDSAFRRHGIEIPFPQRDLHIRDTPRSIERKQLASAAEIAEAAEAAETAAAAAGAAAELAAAAAPIVADDDVAADFENLEEDEAEIKPAVEEEKPVVTDVYRARASTQVSRPKPPQPPRPAPEPESDS